MFVLKEYRSIKTNCKTQPDRFTFWLVKKKQKKRSKNPQGQNLNRDYQHHPEFLILVKVNSEYITYTKYDIGNDSIQYLLQSDKVKSSEYTADQMKQAK